MLKRLLMILSGLALLGTAPALSHAAQPAEGAAVNPVPTRGSAAEWLVLGAFPNPEGETRREGLFVDYLGDLGGEAAARITPQTTVQYTDPQGQSETARVWRVGRGQRSLSQLRALFGRDAALPTENRVAYAFSYLEAPESGTYYLHVGSDDSAKIWVGGALVYDQYNPDGRGVKMRDETATITLEQGLNPILVKIENGAAQWGAVIEVDSEETYAMSKDSPWGFTRIAFPDKPEVGDWISSYLWYHFSNRMGNMPVLFHKEYLAVADFWLNGAYDRGSAMTIQDLNRRFLLEDIQIDEQGYVASHQHVSHAHDWGWPFPLWPQVYGGHAGHSWGWHFQNEPQRYGVWQHGMIHAGSPYAGDRAVEAWTPEHLASEGIVDSAWQLRATGPDPAIVSPAVQDDEFQTPVIIDAQAAPFLHIRWERDKAPENHTLPYVEFQRMEDEDFDPERRVYFEPVWDLHSEITGFHHSNVRMYDHPLWQGKIKRLRIVLAPGESDAVFRIDSIFTGFDTRHTINNPIYVLTCWEYFRWTGDIAFLREAANRMRVAMHYQDKVLGGLELGHIRNPWVGHDSRPGWTKHDNGTMTIHVGHGIGNNYYDLLPFGYDDMYATAQYYASLRAMEKVERLLRENPGWGVPGGALAYEPEALAEQAERVKRVANEKFWNEETGRYYASIDPEGNAYDYGLTFLSLDAIWYGIATEEHARAIMDWIAGNRIVEGDTSTGEDIYRWEFGPRATTLRNIEWYGFAWVFPEQIPWGGQIQDGGAVLGFAFYDLWARLQVFGPDDAWQRLTKIHDWEEKVFAEGGYREYYADGKPGTTLQGGGTAGGIGIDAEFFESSMIPAIVPHGFMGLDPRGDRLAIAPRLPEACPVMRVQDLRYRGLRMDVSTSNDRVEIVLKDRPVPVPLRLEFASDWKAEGDHGFEISQPGTYVFTR